LSFIQSIRIIDKFAIQIQENRDKNGISNFSLMTRDVNAGPMMEVKNNITVKPLPHAKRLAAKNVDAA